MYLSRYEFVVLFYSEIGGLSKGILFSIPLHYALRRLRWSGKKGGIV